MKIQNKNILLISPEPWNHIFVSKHHYAIHLGERGNRVFFLNPPVNKEKVLETDFKNVWSVHYSGSISGLRFYPRVLQRYFIKRKVEKLQRMCGVLFDIVWSFDNSVFFDFSALPKRILKISHIVDLNQNFQTERAAATANICFGVIPLLVDRLKKYNPNTYLITHGVQRFPENMNARELPGNNSIKALYIGNLTMRHINWSLLLNICNRHHEVDFVFIGSNFDQRLGNERDILLAKPNCFFLPPVNSFTIPSYLISADLLLLAYMPSYDDDCASPHKMLEYLNSGKVIVASWMNEYQKLSENGLVLMAKNDHNFEQHFDNAIVNIRQQNSVELMQRRANYALGNTYSKKIEQIESLLESVREIQV